MSTREFRCPKCESALVGVLHIIDDGPTYGERLACTCNRCGYQWNEKPADQEVEK